MIRNVLSFNELKKFCTGATLTAGSGCFSAESPAEGSPLASGEAPFIGECCVAVNERSVRENCAAGLFAFWARIVAVVMLCVMAMSGQGWALSQVGGVYQIGSCKDLKDFSDLVNTLQVSIDAKDTSCTSNPKVTSFSFPYSTVNAKLTKDIDFDADECNGIVMQPIGGDVTRSFSYSGTSWSIISGTTCNSKTSSFSETFVNKYSGTFDGNGHTISNLNISSSSQYVGLFGYVDGGTIKNVKVENSTVTRTGTSTSKEYYTGIIVGYLNSGTVTGVATENASVAGSDVLAQNWSSGGIAGYNGGTISMSSVEGGTIKGRTEVGGIAGTNAKGGTITDCLASPDVLSGSYLLATGIGGIAGKNDGTIYRVVYTGDRVANVGGNNYTVTGGPITGSGSKDCNTLCYYTENVGLQPTGGDAQESDIEKIKATLGAPWDVADEDLIVVNEIYYYTVTIKPNGRGSEQTISVKKNQKIESLDSIMVGGFKRIGLCKDAGCTQKWNLASDQVTANITLYAEWAQAYTVTFTIGTLTDGETGSFPSGATTVKYCVPGEKITADGITSPTFASGVLAGWSRADDGTVDADLGTMGSEAVTVYAIENISNVVNITYKPGTNGTGSELTQKAVPGATVNLKGNLFTRKSYAQDGWATKDGGNSAYELNQSITVPASGLTLYPHWKSTSVKIEYKYSESSAADSSGKTIAAAYKAEDADFNLTNETFTREGYRQDGWSLVEGGNKSYDLGAPYNVNAGQTFYPHWIQVFTVTFNANGQGSAPDALTVDAGSKITEPAVPSAEGYTFNGWNTSADGTGTTWDFNTNTVTANTTLYAIWRANNFTITYDKGEFGTGFIAAGTKTPGFAFTLSSGKFTRSGYEQVGWKTQDGSQTFELGGSYTTDADITLYPVWKQLFTVTFNANGQGEAPESQSVLDGEKATAPTAPTVTGYTFNGWNTKQDGTGSTWDFGTNTVTETTTLYAMWTINTYTVTYEYSLDGTTYQQQGDVDNVTYNAANVEVRNTYMVDGYTMSAWATEDVEVTDGKFSMPAKNVVFRATGTKKNFTITYFIGDTQAGDAVSVEFGGAITPKDTSKTGYTFSGWTWYSLADASNPVQLEESPKAMPAYNLKAVGTFAPTQYTATFDANNGEFSAGVTTATKLVAYDATITADEIATPTRTGYVFKGWSRTQTATAADENLGTMNSTEGVTIYAVWVQTFTVTFNKNGHGSDVETQTVESGSNAVKPDDLSETGYTFAGWFTDDETFENAYEFSSAVTADVTLYAKWTANSYTVTYKITGDYFATEEFETSSASFADVVNVTTKSTDKDGYTFSGWSISEGGVTILNDQFTMGTANVVLTGSYTLNSYTITYNGVDGAINPNTATSYTVESENITLQAATKAGYAFAGWYDNAEFSGDAVTQIAKGTTGNKTFYAKWTAIPVVVTIEGNSETKTYNGESQSVNGYTVKSISCDGYTCTDFTADNVALKSGVTAVASGTDASTTPYLMGLNNTSFETKNTAYTNVTFSVTDGSLTINQASDLSVTLERASFTYDGSVHALTAAATTNAKGGTTKIEYQFDGDTEWTEALASLTKVAAGTYTVNVRATNPNYSNIATNSTTLEISAATITITAADQWFTYTGSAQQVAVATTDIEGTTITYSVDGGDYGLALPSLTNADTVTVTVKAEKANYTTATKTFSFGVAKAPVTVAAENKEQVYGAEAATLTATVTGKPESGAAVNYTLARGEGANVGTYAINVTLGENPNYEITTTAGTYTITKKAVVVKATAASKTYGDADPELTSSVEGLVGDDKVEYTVSRATGENVGEYEITASGAATQGNYSVSYEPAKFTINQLEATLAWSNTEFNFDGAEHVPTATVSNLVGTDACTVTVTGAASAAGEHTATATALSNTNYKLPASVTQTFNIKAGAFAVTLSDNVTYNGTKQTPTVTVKDGGKTLELGTDYTVAWDNSGFTNAGNYEVTVTGKGNYTGSETATYTILKKTATIAVDAASKTYGDAEPAFTGKVEGLVNDADLGTIAYVRTDAATDKDAGTYTNKLTATYTENANYTVTVTPADFTINQLVATLSWSNVEFDYDGAEHAPTATVSNLVGTDACTVTVTGAASAAGEHTATATALSNANYKLPASTTQTFNIKAGAFAVTLSAESATYNGTAQVPTVTVKDGTKTLELNTDYTVAWDNDGFTNAGDYKVTVTGKGNYTGSETATYTILKKAISVAVSGNNGTATYDGTDHKVDGFTATTTETLYNVESVALAEGKLATATTKNVDKVMMGLTEASFVNNDNNFIVTFTVTDGYSEVTPKAVTVKAIAASKTYGEADPTLASTVEGLVTGESETLIARTVTRATGENVGTYTITASGDASQGNYSVSYEPATFTIDQLVATLAWTGTEFDFDGAEHVPIATVSNLVGTDACTVTVTGVASAAGEHTATATALSNTNYKLPASTTQTFNIKAGAFAVTLSENVTYNGTKQTPTVTVKDGGKTLELGTDYTVAWDNDGFTNAGDYKVTVTGKGNYTGSETATYTILKKTATIAVDAASKTYGEIDPTFTGKVEGLVNDADLGTIAYVRTDATTDVNVGTYTNKLTATYTENANYTVTVTPADFTIDQLEATLSWSNVEFDYDGAEHVPTATVSNLVGTDACTVTVTGAASAAGEHTATATALSNTNYKLPASVTQTFNIKAGAFAVTLSDNVTYNGTKQTPTVTVKDGTKTLVLDADYTVAWDNDGFTNAGDYKVTVTGKGNYTGSETATYTILKKTATIAVDAASKTYGAADPTFTGKVEGLVNDADLGTIAYVRTDAATDVNAGTYTNKLTATFTENANYTVSVTPATFTISQLEATLAWSNTEFNFDGAEHTPTATVSNLVGTDACTVTVTGAASAAGEHTATATALSNANYKLPASVTQTFNIKAGAFAVTLSDNVTYNGTKQTPTVTVKDGTKTLVLDADYTVAWDNDGFTNAGDYKVTVTGKGNYTGSETATYTILKKTATIAVDAASKTYGAADPTFTGKVEGLVNDADLGTIAYVRTDAATDVNAGTYTNKLTATFTENANYTVSVTPATFTISQLEATLAWNNTEFDFDGAEHVPTATVSNLVGTDACTVTVTGAASAAGEHTATATAFSNANYKLPASATQTFNIKAGAFAVTLSDNVTYNGTKQTPTVTVKDGGKMLELGTDYTVAWDNDGFTNAGDYKVTVTGKGNYTGEVKKTYTINPKAATLAWGSAEFTYTGVAQAPTATVSNLVEGDECSVTVTGAGTDADNYTATATALNNSNYALPESGLTKAFSIAQATIVVETESAKRAYNGTALTAGGSIKSGLVNGETASITLTGTQTNVGTSENSFTMVWGTAKLANYKISSTLGTLEVIPAAVTVTADNKQKTFGETDPTFTATVAGTVGEDNVVYTLTRVEGENVGTYTITASGEASQGNYSVTYETATFTIAKATVNTVTVAIDGWTFGESAKTPTASATFKADGEPVVTYAVKGSDSWSATAPTAAGEYTVKATVAETDNYVGGSATKDFTIAKAGFSVAGTNYEDVYDGASHGAAATPSVTEGTTVSYSTDNGTTWSTTAPTIKNVGEISVSVKAENANYETATTTYTLKVTKRAIKLVSASDRKFYDGTALTASTVTVTEGSYANGESFQYNVTGSQTEVGESDNEFTYSATSSASSAKVENYEVTLVKGKLTVNPVVTFVMNGHGTQVAKQEVLTGEKASEPTEPSVEGYTFGGWFTDNETFANAYDFNAAVNANTTLYAKWTVNRYTVTWWKSEEKRQAHDQKTDVPFDSVITAPTKDAPTKQGYLFDKWTSTDVTVAEDGSFTMPAKAVDLVPAWKLETYSITYELNGGTNAVSNPATYNFETETFNFADPTRDGFVFLGWYGKSDFSGSKITGVEKGSVGDMKLYAYWANDAYTITYNPGEYGEGGLAAGKKVYGKPFTLSADDKFTRVGYTQTGWTTTDGGSQVYAFGDSYTTDADITLYPVWRINTHSVTFMVGEKIIRYDGEVTYGMEVTAPTAPDSLGYTFAQWQSDNEGISSLGVNGKFNMIDEDVVAKALYWVDTYKLTYDLGDGTCGTCSELTGYNVTEKVTLPTDVEKTGYTFGGWFDNDKFEGSAVTEIAKGSTGDKKFYAKWTINNYTITYKITGDYFKNDAFVTGSADFGTVVDTTTTSTVQEGYTFSGWSVAEGGVTLENGKFTMGTANVVLTGSYSINSYDVVWKKDDATYSSSSVAYGVEVVAPATAPTKNGYDFAGWTTSDVTLADDYSFTMPAKAVTLNADWDLVTYEIAYESNGGEAVPSSNYTIESADITLPTTTRLGYDFGGWFDNENLSGTAVTKVAAGSFGNKKFYAKWDVVTYNITYTGLGDMTHENPATYTVEDAVVLTDPTDSTGYSFDGWYIGEDKVTSIAKGSTGAKTIVAKWSPKNVEFKVVYELYGATGSKEKTMDEVTLEGPADAPIIENITWKDFGDGYDYELVYINDVEHNKSYFTDKIARDGSTVVKVRVEHNEFTFTFYTEGESGWKKWDEQPLYYGYDEKENYNVKAPTAPTKTGYTFVGWCADAETCESVQTFPMNVPAKNMKFYAKWTINPYTITFDTKGGSTVVAITQDYNTAVTAPENPTRTGYLFAGWDKEIPATMPAEDITITAKWDMDVKASGYTGVYDGDAHGIVVTAPEGATITYSTAEDGDYVAALTYADVGTYTVYYKASQEGYADVKGSATVAITPATMTLVVAGYADTYDGAAHSGTATPSVTEGTTVSYSTDNGTTWNTTAPTIKDVGEISVSVKAENANYETATNSYTLKVTPKAVVVKATAAQKTYGDADPEFTGKVEGLVAETDLGEITYFREGLDVNVGTYTDVLTAAYTPNNNYNVTISKGVFTIGKRSVTFTGEDDTREYTGSEIELTNVTVGDDGLLSGHTHNVTYSAKGIEVGKYNGVITNAADVKIMAGDVDVTKNYIVSTSAGSLSILVAGAFTIALEDDIYIYNGTARYNVNSVTNTARSGTTTFQYQFEGDGETWVGNLEDLVKVNAGEYIINVKATNTNYADMATTTAKLTIIPKTATVSAVDAGKTLGSKDPELLATITGVVGEDKLEYVVVRDEGENVGYYQIAPVGAENQGNYRVAYEPARFTISPVVKVVLAKGMELICTESECDADGNIKYTYGKETTLPAAKVSDDESWIFQGLFENEKLAGTPVTKISADVTKNVTLYPNFTKNIIAKTDSGIVFIAKDMDDTQDSLNRKVTVAARVAFPLPRKSSDGLYSYRFTEYAYNAETDVYEAQFVGVPQKFLVTFNLPEGAVLSTEFETYTYGETTKLPTASIKGAEDWEFKGWYTKPDGNGTRVKAISAGEFGEKTLYPLFQKTIAYDANGARGEVSAIYAENAEMVINAALADVVPQDYVKKGKTYTFDKWVLENGTYVAKFTQTDALKAASVPHFTVSVMNRVLEISGARMGAKVAVFDMRGTLVASGIVENGTQRVEIAQPGSYIVRVNNQATRVNVR